MAYLEKDLANVKGILREESFELLNYSVSPLTTDEEIQRGIDSANIPRLYKDACKQYLTRYTSVKNGEKENSTVTNPMAGDREVFDGLWRCVAVNYIVFKGKEYLVEILRKGYLQTVLNDDSTVNWSEARVVEGANKQPIGATNYKFLTIRWLNCAPDKVNTISAQLNSATFTNPVIKGETYTGVWYNSGVFPALTQDGSGMVVLQLSLEYRELPFYKEFDNVSDVTEVRQQLGLTSETQELMGITAWSAGTTYSLGQQVSYGYTVYLFGLTVPYTQTGIWISLENGNLGNAPSLTSTHWKIGVIKSQQISLNQDNSKNVHTSKKTATAISLPEYITHLGEHETVYHSEERHSSSAPSVYKYKTTDLVGGVPTVVEHTLVQDTHGLYYLDGGNKVYCNVSVLAHDLDEFLLHNYKKSRTVRTPPIPFGTEKTWTIWEWEESATSQQFSTRLQRWWVDSWRLWHNYKEYSIQYFKTLDEAVAYINDDDGYEGSSLINSTGSEWRQTGEYEYMGLKVRHKQRTIIYQTYLEPSI